MRDSIENGSKSDWLQCPYCESEIVAIYSNYDNEIKFKCIDCGKETPYDFDNQWTQADINEYHEDNT